MRTPPTEMIRLLAPFAPLFSKRVFQHVQVLLMGAILAPGKRTVSSALKAMGLDQQKRFHRYHRVLSDSADPIDKLAIAVLARAACFAAGEAVPRDLLLSTLNLPDDSSVPDYNSEVELQAEDAISRLIELGLLRTEESGSLRGCIGFLRLLSEG
jgi:hypothetical protein